MDIKIKLLYGGQVPTYATKGAAGCDLYAYEDYIFEHCPTQPVLVMRTGVCVEIPPGYEGKVKGRSSAFVNGLIVHDGVIDSDYRGELGVLVYTLTGSFHILKGDRIAQLVISPVVRAEFKLVGELGDTVRGQQGFGSTGK